MTQPALQGETLFRKHFWCWRILGNLAPQNYRNLYVFYSIVANILITVGYPLHLLIGVMQSTNLHDAITNLTICLASTVCSIKTVVIWMKFKNVRKIIEIIRRQDKRIISTDEVEFYKTIVFPSVSHILYLFYFICIGCGGFSELAVISNGLMGKWRLMSPGYFPFDVFATSWSYFAAHMYQFFGLLFQGLQNLVNDTFAGMHLALLSGQIKILSMRVAKIGHNPKKTQAENNQELLDCIQDHLDLLQYRSILEQLVSLYMFFQIFFAGINMCLLAVFIILYVRDPFSLAFYALFALAIPSEILPSCYYGTIMELEFQNLSYALFSSNWMDQDIPFKKNLRIIAEQANKKLHISAWLFHINLNSFLSACKNAYSLFAVVMNMK